MRPGERHALQLERARQRLRAHRRRPRPPRGGFDAAKVRRPRRRSMDWAAWLTAPLLALALALAGIAADENLAEAIRGAASVSSDANVAFWFALPLLLAAMTLVLALRPRIAQRGPALLVLAVALLAWLAFRLWIAFLGPTSYLEFRAIADLLIFGLIGLVFWLTAGIWPSLIHGVWLAGLTIVFFARLHLSSTHFLFRADLLPVLVSALWGVVAFSGAVRLTRDRRFQSGPDREEILIRERLESSPPRPSSVLGLHVAALALGAGLAWMSLAYVRPEDPTALAALADRTHAIRLLWSRSVLPGWGRAVLLRRARVMNEPISVAPETWMPEWMGPFGFLGAQGVIGLLLMVLLVVGLGFLAWRRAAAGTPLAHPAQAGLIAASLLAGLMLVGGPNSALPGLLIAGWLGLAFADYAFDPQAEHAAPVESFGRLGAMLRFARPVCAYAAVVLLAALTLVAAAPAASRVILDGVRRDLIEYDPEVPRRLRMARLLNPWDPRVELARGAWHRQELDRRSGWDESVYLRAVQAYERAMNLAPYDVIIPMRLAEIQRLAGREADALRTMRRALALNPNSPELIEMIFLNASDQGSESVALAMIRRSLEIEPRSERWWMQRFIHEQRAGNGPEANRALDAALTGALDGEAAAVGLIQASWERAKVRALP